MDETLRRISDLLVRRREELREHFKTSDVQENTTESLVDRVERMKSRLESSVRRSDDDDKDR
jgi:hypothetical protein